jgi:regulator of sigma E protease
MSWLLAFLGFAALIVLHELGHFAAAKAVGMRVERFALFFPPLLFKVRRGETEYGVGAIPLGGYVRITGMNPNEEIAPEVAHRAYYRQPVWKRIVVIAAGPAVNIVLAFVLLVLYLVVWGVVTGSTNEVEQTAGGSPAAKVLRSGDRIVAVDGRRGAPQVISDAIGTHTCAGGVRVVGCVAGTPARVTVTRDGVERTFSIKPVFQPGTNGPQNGRMLIGVSYAPKLTPVGLGKAASMGVDEMWFVTHKSVEAIAGVFNTEKRKELSGVVGSFDATRQAFAFSTSSAVFLLAVISLSLGVINLFPFLPLDGGHIFWALAEKVRGRAIPFAVMERAGFIGFALVIGLFVIGLSNDIGRISGNGFQGP